MSESALPPRTRALPRPDIQVLRALAVGGVLVYHLWPGRFPGGYVGVDVFFVVSGFLITSHLLSSATGPDGVHLGRFWARRARRLLPLAGFVLLTTVIAAYLVMPASTWASTFRNAAAAAVYLQNWLLAKDSVNYLTRDAPPSPTQHFWSLSVEEQFYIVWPLLFLVAIWLVRRIRRDRQTDDRMVRRVSFILIALVVAASFAASVVLTITDPSLAYFATTTRAWEFAAGGLLGYVVSSGMLTAPGSTRVLVLRTAGSWIGYAGIAATMLLLPEGVPFPGWVAAIPVAATLLCLASGEPGHRFAPTVLGRLRPVTYLGDISYGVYMWHWPLIIILTSALGELTTLGKVGIIAATIALAAISKVAIEDPFRFGIVWSRPWWRGFIPAGVSMALVLVVTLGGLGMLRSQSVAPVAVASPTDLGTPPTLDPELPLVPAIELRTTDNQEMYDCFDLTHEQSHRCTFGLEGGAPRIAVAGDSHAAMYLPALRAIAVDRGWQLDTFVGLSCDGPGGPGCFDGQSVPGAIIAGDYDMVLVTSFRGSSTPVEEVEVFWRELMEAGVPLTAIVDVPRVTSSSYACIDSSHGDPSMASRCIVPRDEALDSLPDRVEPIATELGLPVVDPTPLLCDESGCPQVLGNIVLYQDINAHLTRTAVLALRPWLESEVDERLADAVS